MRKEAKALTTLAEVFSKRKNDDGMSCQDLVRETGWSEDKVRTLLKEAHVQNKLNVGRRMVTGIDGINRSVPVYRVSV